MSNKNAGRWTKTPPQGKNVVSFMQVPAEVGAFLEENKDALRGVASVPPRVAQRIVGQDGRAAWLVAGSGAMWDEQQLIRKAKKGEVLFWSKTYDIPMISISIPDDEA